MKRLPMHTLKRQKIIHATDHSNHIWPIISRRADKDREELIKQLQNPVLEIKTLRGFLPICSSCKNIRDDKKYWNRLESYIEKHSEAVFSHGICPSCMDRLYGKKEWYINMKAKKNKDP